MFGSLELSYSKKDTASRYVLKNPKNIVNIAFVKKWT